MAAIMMIDETWFRVPESMRFHLHGKKAPYVTGKDVILKCLQDLGVDGALYRSMEFGGPGHCRVQYRRAHGDLQHGGGGWRQDHIVEADAQTEGMGQGHLQAALYADQCGCRRRVLLARHDYDLSRMVPMVAKPCSPDNVVPVGEIGSGIKVDQVYMGNCANGTISDLRQIASVLKGRKVAKWTRVMIVPATQKIYREAMAEGLIDQFIGDPARPSRRPPAAPVSAATTARSTTARSLSRRSTAISRGAPGMPGRRSTLGNSYVAAATAIAGEIIDPAKL